MSKPFRVAIMAVNYQFSVWTAEVIQFLQEIPEVEISLLIFEGKRRIAQPAPPVPRLERLFKALRDGSLLAKVLDRFNWLGSKSLWPRYRRWQAGRGRLPSERPVNLSETLAEVPVLVCNTQAKGRFAEIFYADDVSTIRTYELDAILKFGFNIVHGDV